METIAPAQRLSHFKKYYFARKLQEVKQLQQDGKKIINLGIGNPDMAPDAEVTNIARHFLESPDVHGYANYPGHEDLLKAFAQWFKQFLHVPLSEGQALVSMGGKEAIMMVSLAFLNPGDKVLIPDPGYPAYASAAYIAGAEPVPYPLSPGNGYIPDFDALKVDFSRVKVLWVNYPHMPTGARASKSDFRKMKDFAARNNILIVNDNPYAFVRNDKPLSILEDPAREGNVLEIHSLSKAFNMAGWRVGLLAGNQDLLELVLKMRSQMNISHFLPIQFAAARAFQLGEAWHSKINRVYKEREAMGLKILETLACEVVESRAGMFLWARLPHGVRDDKKFSDTVLGRAGVFLTPGSVFGQQGEAFIRLSLSRNTNELNQALVLIQQNKAQILAEA